MSVINLFTWIDPEIIKLIADLDKVKKIIERAEKI